MKYTKGEILLNDEIQTGIYKMVVKDKNKAKAGQFYMLKHNGTTLLPRPISVCETNGETLTFVYAVVGNGTKEYAELKYSDDEFEYLSKKYNYHAKPFTKESLLYREIFEKHYPNQAEMIHDFWMPNKSWEGCDVSDPSARVLSNYGDSGK